MPKSILQLLKVIINFMVVFIISTNLIHAQIAGSVYKDYNSNGQRDLPNEHGVSNVLINAYLASGQLLSTNTDVNGGYNFTAIQIPFGEKVRIEIENLRGDFAGLSGVHSKTTVFFTTGGDLNASLGILGSKDFCEFDGPDILTSCYVSGDPLGGGTAGEDAALVTFPYTASGLAGIDGAPSVNYVAKIREVGSVWGMTYQSTSKKFLVSSLVRRHSGLGPLGTGGIYMVDDFNQTAVQFLDVKTLGIDTGSDPRINASGQNIALPADKITPNEDSLTMHTAGKMGIGSITLSRDEKTLFFVNLYDRKLYSVEVGVPMSPPTSNSTVKSYDIPDPSGVGDYRPWALTEKNGDLYVGVVTSAESTQDTTELNAHVYKLNVDTGVFKEIFQMPLNYKKGYSDVTDQCIHIDSWRAWSDVFPQGCARHLEATSQKWVNFAMNPQAILSSIQFDVDGSLILGFMDRFGLFAGFRNLRPVDDGMLYDGFVGGDLLRAQYDSFQDKYILESNGVSGDLVGVGFANGEGPGGGEFFGDDKWEFKGNVGHAEITNGGIMIIPGTGEIIASAMDPIDEIFQSGGIRVFDRTNGELLRGFALYSDVPGTLGKSGGVGEFKMSCEPTPIEVGNRVWNDLNKNGIQDPSEPGIDGVIITLHDMENGGVEIGSMSTVNGGLYSFNANNISNLEFDRNYEIRLSLDQEVISNGQFVDVSPSNNDVSNNGEERDSDGIRTENMVRIAINSGFPGKTTNSFDFGLVECSVPLLSQELEDLVYCENAIPVIDLENAPVDAKWSLGESYPEVQIDSSTGVITGISQTGEYWVYLTNIINENCRDSLKITIRPTQSAGLDFKFCSSEKVVQLNPGVIGGTWSAVPNNPSNVTFNQPDHQASDFLADGIFLFQYRIGGCSDTVQVERLPTPSAGKDSIICDFINSVRLSSNLSGGQWTSSQDNKVSSQISNTGLVTGLIENGNYEYIYSLNGCTDTVRVTRVNCELGAIGNFAWFDANRNGIQDQIIDPSNNISAVDELPAKGIKLKLYLSGGTSPIDSATTNELGLYQFNDLLPGNYFVKFDAISIPGSNFEISPQSSGSSSETDSDFGTANQRTADIPISLGEKDLTWDIGFFASPEISISSSCACNQDIIYLSGPENKEKYIFNEIVEVKGTPGSQWRIITSNSKTASITKGIRMDIDNDGYPEIINDPVGISLNPDPTDASKFYLEFSHSEPEGYELVVSDGVDTLSIANSCVNPPEEYDPKLNDLCAFEEEFQLQEVFNAGTAKYFFLQYSKFEFNASVDVDELISMANPISRLNPRNYPPGSTIALYVEWTPTSSGCVKKTILNIKLSNESSCLGNIGDFTWIDMNGNGQFDASESPLPGISVTLLDSLNDPVSENGKGIAIVPQITGINGLYEFKDLIPGKYSVLFGEKIGFERTTSNQGNDSVDSDPDPVTGRTSQILIGAGESNLTLDAGYLPKGSIGDFVWYDLDKNGIQNLGENGVFRVGLNLYLVDDNNNASLISSTSTNPNGNYLFQNLSSGKYFVEMGTNIPAGYQINAIKNAGSNLEVDNDFNKITRRSDIVIIDNKNPLKRNITDVDAGIVSDCVEMCVVIKITKTK